MLVEATEDPIEVREEVVHTGEAAVLPPPTLTRDVGPVRVATMKTISVAGADVPLASVAVKLNVS